MSRYYKWISALVFFGLLVGAFGFGAGPSGPQTAGLQPALAEMAAEKPDGMVRVMVGARGERADLTALVEGLGGEVVRDLHILNALAAEMPAGAAAELARYTSVAWLSLDGQVVSSGKGGKGGGGGGGGSADPSNYFLDTLSVEAVWAMGYQGEGVAIAVIDSGVGSSKDFYADPTANGNHTDFRIRQRLSMDPLVSNNDATGHGTHVAGIIAGNGYHSSGAYTGIAPMADLISISVSNSLGFAYESDTVGALQWVLDNKDTYNIRVVNISLNSTVEQSYHQSPLNAATEILWFNGIVVVTSSGNKGIGGQYNTVNAAPANDPFVITVGAADEMGNANRGDDHKANFTAFGLTDDGHLKPEILAPGADIVSILAANSTWKSTYPDRVTSNGKYFRASGTSMAAPMVSGAAALLLQAEPNLTPDQVKYRLLNTGSTLSDPGGSWAYLDVYDLLTTSTTASANTGLVANQLLWTGSDPITWGSVNWNSVNWNSVNWNSVNWNSVNWNSVNWNSVDWGN